MQHHHGGDGASPRDAATAVRAICNAAQARSAAIVWRVRQSRAAGGTYGPAVEWTAARGKVRQRTDRFRATRESRMPAKRRATRSGSEV